MSYVEQYKKRLASLINPDEFATILIVRHKRAVDYSMHYTREFVSKSFDLETRGMVSDVFRTLIDRINQVYECDVEKAKRYNLLQKGVWQSPTEKKSKMLSGVIRCCWDKAVKMLLGYLECVELLDGPKAGWTEILHQVGFFFMLSLEGTLEEFLKYQTASLSALSLGNECDVQPDVVRRGHWRTGDFLPYCRRITFWVRKLGIQRRSPKGVQLCFSIYNVKRIAPSVDEAFIAKALQKNLKALTEERNLPDIIRLKGAVIRTVRELFQASKGRSDFDVPQTNCDYRNKMIRRGLKANPNHLKIPSLAACYENNRRLGGSLNYLLQQSNTLKKLLLPGEAPFLGYITLKGKFASPVPVYGCLDEYEMISLMRPSLDGRGGRVYVRREAVLEPFKVRIISKGEAVPYQRAQNYQPFLWSILQLSPWFELTGRPAREGDIPGLVIFARSTNLYTTLVSGDYSAATDNLHPYLCLVALQEIVRLWRIPFEDALNMVACLTEHNIDAREKSIYTCNKISGQESQIFDWKSYLEGNDLPIRSHSDVEEVYKQVWGQLMGSPLSFPILCIVNGAVTRESQEKAFERTITIFDRALLINGDDVLFPIPPLGYQTWVRNVTSAGLTPSIGKNFLSRRYGIINSQVFDCGLDWDWKERACVDVKKVPLLYLNLLHIQSDCDRRKDQAILVGDAMSRGGDLESRMNDLIDGWCEEKREKFLKRAYHYARPVLDLLPPVSWVLPKSLGGLGLPKTRDHRVSDLHMKIATMILCLDETTRRDVVRLQWLRQPGNVFCESTNEQIQGIQEQLGNSMMLSTSKTEDHIFSRLIKSNLGWGVDKTVLEPLKVLKAWNNMYSGWVKRVQRIKWTDCFDNTGTGLRKIGYGKLSSYAGTCWTWKYEAAWVS